MDGGIIALLIVALIAVFFGATAIGGNSNFGSQGGGARKKFGIVGLLIFLFGILGISNYFQNIN